MTKINKTKFLKALKGTAGIISQIAKNLGVQRKSVYEYIERTPEVKPYIKQEKEQILDLMEGSMIHKAVVEKDFKALNFYLKTIGKDRGYTEKIETELSGGVDNKIIFEIVDPTKKEEEK